MELRVGDDFGRHRAVEAVRCGEWLDGWLHARLGRRGSGIKRGANGRGMSRHDELLG